MSLCTAQAQETYVGGAASSGTSISGTGSVSNSSIATLVDVPSSNGSTTSSFVVPVGGETITLNQVNFFSGVATGQVTPFLAYYSGNVNSTAAETASDYTVIAVGDPLNVTSTGLQNDSFTINGVDPTLTLAANDVVVAGFFDSVPGDVKYITGTSSEPFLLSDNLPASTPGVLTKNFQGLLSENLLFDVGFTVDASPEPSTLALMLAGLGGLAIVVRRHSFRAPTTSPLQD